MLQTGAIYKFWRVVNSKHKSRAKQGLWILLAGSWLWQYFLKILVFELLNSKI